MGSPDESSSGGTQKVFEWQEPAQSPSGQAQQIDASGPRRNLSFIHLSNPADAKSQSMRRAVRSQAARQQPHQQQQGQSSRPPRNSSKATKRGKRRTGSNASDVGESQPSTPGSSGSHLALVSPDDAPEASHSDDAGLSASKDPLLAGRVSPSAYPIPWQPFIPTMVQYYLTKLCVETPELDGPQPGLYRTRFWPLILATPAAFYAVMLLAASHYTFVFKTPDSERVHIHLDQLRYEAIRSLNNLLKSSSIDVATGDGAVGAVLTMATYEVMFDDHASYHIHMRGLKRMVESRGGLQALGLGGLLERQVLWLDHHAATMMGSDLYFTGFFRDENGTLKEPTDRDHFLGLTKLNKA